MGYFASKEQEEKIAQISQSEAADWARAYLMGLRELRPYVPSCPVYNHDPSEYYFFWVRPVELRVGGDEVIAVRKSDGEISHCGLVGE